MKTATSRKESEQEKDLLRINEAAEYYGMSKQWFYNEIMNKRIPAYRLNRTLFVSKAEMNDRIRGIKSVKKCKTAGQGRADNGEEKKC